VTHQNDTTAAGAPTPLDARREGDTVRLRGAARGGAELAGRLLAADGVRSVILDHARDEATVRLKSTSATKSIDEGDNLLREIASLASQQQVSLEFTTQRLKAAPEILCWLDRASGVDSYCRAPQMVTGWKRAAYLAAAGVAFAAAALGALLPGLPTTPLLLVTAYLLLRSSRTWHNRLMRSRFFGSLLRDWQTHQGVRPGVKAKSLLAIATVLTATLLLGGLPTWAIVSVIALASCGVLCVARLRVIR